MTDAVESMAYAGEVPWHGLGNKVSNNLTPEQMLKAAKIDWTVSKRQMFFQKNGVLEPYPDRFALVRDSDEHPFDVVSKKWKPVQNAEAFEFFKKFVIEAKMTMETAGALWDGKYVWALARLKKDFELGNKAHDKIQSYLLLMSPHEHGKALVALYTAIRVVCWNTLSMALGANLKGGEGTFRMPHSVAFNETTREAAAQALGLAVAHTEQFHEAATLLTKAKIKEDEVDEYFCEVLRFDPKAKVKVVKGQEEQEQREPLLLPKFRVALNKAPGQELPTARGTMWGALNAVTYVIDHENGRDRQTALKNAWFGNMANVKQRALDIAIKRAS